MRFRSLLLLLFLFEVTALQAQTDLELSKLRTDIVPHSPEAEAMAKYGVLPMTLYTGMPQVNVPLYEIKASGGLTIPVSLSYSSNGYRPTEIASWVGHGWSVQGSGVITRIVKGQVDGTMTSGNNYDNYVNVNGMNWKQPFLKNVGDGIVDAEPDLYVFNIGGLSGKFIMVKGKAYLFPHQNLQITGGDNGFKIVDDKGNIYLFNFYETTWHKSSPSSPYIPPHNSAWYISRIVTADKKDTIDYTYAPYTYKQQDTYMESYSIDGRYTSGNNTTGQSLSQRHFLGDRIDALQLRTITSKYATIVFMPSDDDRLDAANTGNKYLDKIIVSGSGNSTLYKEIKLTHSYLGSGLNVKLKLDEVIFHEYSPDPNGDGLALKDSSRYSFDYETGTVPLPATKGIDLWGYYNGNDGNSMLFPSGIFSPALYPYADRDADINYSKLGMLKKITYPTRGYSTFEYEQNQKGHYNISSTYTNDSIDLYDTYTSTMDLGGYTMVFSGFTLLAPQWVKLSYAFFDETGGSIPTMPVLKITKYSSDVYTAPLQQAEGWFNDSVYLDAGTYNLRMYCQQNIDGTEGKVYYKKYTVDNTLADAPGLRIKTISSYDDINNVTPALVKNYLYNEGVELSRDGITSSNLHNNCSNYNITTIQSGIISSLTDLIADQFFYKEVTEVNRDAKQNGKTFYTYETQNSSLEDVKLMSQTDYKYAGTDTWVPVRSTANQYQGISRNTFYGLKVHQSEVIGPVCNACTGCAFLISPDITQPSALLQQIYMPLESYALTSDYTLLSQTKETLYNDSGENISERQTDYYYDNSDHIQPTRIVTKNSFGEQMTTELKYPLDYSFGSCSSLTGLNNNFKTDLSNGMNSMYSCYNSLVAALQPYQPYSPNTTANQQSFSNIVSQYNCEATLKTGMSTALTNRDNAWNNYQTCLTTGISNNTTAWQKAVLWMEQNNVVSPVIEKYISVKKTDGNEYLLSATRNEYAILNGNAVMPVNIKQAEIYANLLKSSFLANTDNYYKQQVNFTYDNQLNLASQNQVNNLIQSYLWGYQNEYPIAQVINADNASIAHTSFEADAPGNFTYSGTSTNTIAPVTGDACYNLGQASGSISKTGLTSTKKYIFSYWTKNAAAYSITGTQGSPVKGETINGWTNYLHTITGVTGVTLSGTGYVDELRLYPSDAQMTTFTYTPLVGMTSQCDVNNRVTYYNYDVLGRLIDIKDPDGNILKTIDYHFKH